MFDSAAASGAPTGFFFTQLNRITPFSSSGPSEAHAYVACLRSKFRYDQVPNEPWPVKIPPPPTLAGLPRLDPPSPACHCPPRPTLSGLALSANRRALTAQNLPPPPAPRPIIDYRPHGGLTASDGDSERPFSTRGHNAWG